MEKNCRSSTTGSSNRFFARVIIFSTFFASFKKISPSWVISTDRVVRLNTNLFARFEARKFSRDDDAAGEDVRRYLNCELLILDDLGSEFSSPFIQAALYEVVNTRLAQGQRTVISSNLNMPAIRQRYTPQLASRLEGEYLFLPFFGQDIRLLKKGQR